MLLLSTISVLITFVLDFLGYLLRQLRYRLFPRHHSIRGWSILVTGAGSGMGRATALRLADMGVSRIFAIDMQKAQLLSLQQECANIMGFDGCVPILCDLRKTEEIQRTIAMVRENIEKTGTTLNAIVNVAGVPCLGPLAAEGTDLDEEWDWLMDVNARAPARLVQGLFPSMLKPTKQANIKGSRIIFVTSGSSFSRFPYMGLYAISKGSLEIYSDTLRRELAPWGVGVVSVVPTAINTPMWDSLGTVGDRKLTKYDSSIFSANLMRTYEFFLSMKPHCLPATDVADTIIEAMALEHPKPRYLVDSTPLLTWLSFLLPDQLADYALARLIFGRKVSRDLFQ